MGAPQAALIFGFFCWWLHTDSAPRLHTSRPGGSWFDQLKHFSCFYLPQQSLFVINHPKPGTTLIRYSRDANWCSWVQPSYGDILLRVVDLHLDFGERSTLFEKSPFYIFPFFRYIHFVKSSFQSGICRVLHGRGRLLSLPGIWLNLLFPLPLDATAISLFIVRHLKILKLGVSRLHIAALATDQAHTQHHCRRTSGERKGKLPAWCLPFATPATTYWIVVWGFLRATATDWRKHFLLWSGHGYWRQRLRFTSPRDLLRRLLYGWLHFLVNSAAFTRLFSI